MPPSKTNSPSRLILVDIENLSGKNPRHLSDNDLTDLLLTTRDFLDLDDTDTVVVASNPAWRQTISCYWTGCQIKTRHGKDGADQELCALASQGRIALYHALWIVSGDHAFIKPAATARALNVRTVVVARPEGLSHRLSSLADRTIPFAWEPPSSPTRYAA